MLVLSRKKEQTIMIGENVEVVIIDVRRNRVRLGFRCPSDVAIMRKELRRGSDERFSDYPLAQDECPLVGAGVEKGL
jgi:carbon storage regulator CsrA